MQPDKFERTGPPHNPELRDLIEGKRKWSSSPTSSDAKRGFRGWTERGYLPHRDEPGLVQFVTFRLADSFPLSLRFEWEGLMRLEDNRERRRQLERYLDKGHGACHLKNSRITQLVQTALLTFHGNRYHLRAWAIMPNHVHVLFETGEIPMSVIVQGWKSWTSKMANRILRSKGQFWEEDYWDTYMRSEDQLTRVRRYIEQNPVKAKLVPEARDWLWSSAHYRDERNALILPEE